MKIKRDGFVAALSEVLPGLSEKAIVEQTDHFILDGDYIRTSNDEIAVSFPFHTGFSLAVKGDEFFRLISKINSEEIELDVEEGALHISAGKTEAVMVISKEIKGSVIIRSRRWYDLPKNFSDAMRFCSFSSGENVGSGLQILNNLWIKDQYVISSDRLRVSKYEMDSKVTTEFLLPTPAAQGLVKVEPISYAVEDAWIHFKNKAGAIFSSRVVEGEYPEEVWGLFTRKGDSVLVPEGLSESIDRAQIFSKEVVGGDDLVRVKIDSKAGRLFCRGEGSLGWIEEELKTDFKKDLEFKVSPEHFIEILEYVKEMLVSDDKIYFSGPNFEHVISLV